MKTHTAVIRWTVSRGRDTYGYNICTLMIDGIKVASCDGGGYDMEGTVLGEWLEEAYADRLLRKKVQHYGLKYRSKDNKSWADAPDRKHRIPKVDGACGTVRHIMQAIGISATLIATERNGNKTLLIEVKERIPK